MPVALQKDLYIDLTATGNPLVSSLTDRTPLDIFRLVAGDEFALRLWFVTRSGNAASPLVNATLAAGSVIRVSAKKISDVAGAALLIDALGFTETVDGDNTFYAGSLNCNTVELLAAMAELATYNQKLDIRIDIEIENADNTQRLTFQCTGAVLPQVTGTGAAPTPLPVANGIFAPFICDAYTGGTATNLDGIATVDLTVGRVIALVIGGVLEFHQLIASTPAASPDGTAPVDYDESTNQKIWIKRL